MIKCIVAIVVAGLAFNASAEVFKCKGSDGKVQFSDTHCQAGSASEVMPDRLPVTSQQRQEAQQRGAQMQREAASLEENEAIAQGNRRASAQRRSAEQDRLPPAAPATANADAYANCIRDVERHGASQNVKAELIAACRTAGRGSASGSRNNYGDTRTDADTVAECVRSVERTGASEAEKSRQLAICHGGDVRPHYLPVPVRRTGSY
jgi:hypothetical protein